MALRPALAPVSLLLLACAAAAPVPQDDALRINSPMKAPEWATLQRDLLDAHLPACEAFFAKYFDDRGWLKCVERWGGDDGPDDAIENVNDWPILHALGADDRILHMTKKAWEGHLDQYTKAKTVDVPLAREGMYFQEFPVMFDWQHNGEGLSVFNLMGLSSPDDPALHRRARRFADLYLGMPNYDPKHKIIRSLFNGSRGPLLRKSTGLDWAGDPFDVSKFEMVHGERTYAEVVAHFKDYNDIVGDHPLNLLSTTLALNAYMIDHDPKYRTWLLEYIDAWVERMAANNDIIPSNIGLDGTIGGETDGKWYGGVYGWSFTVEVPQTGKMADRNRQYWGFIGFANAYLLTGDDKYLEAWRKQADRVNGARKKIDGTWKYPRMYGDQGWYGFDSDPYTFNALQIWYLSMKESDARRVPSRDWMRYLAGKNDGYPVKALKNARKRLQGRARAMRKDRTTPKTRLADNPMKYNPASVEELIHLMLGGIHITRRASALNCRVRYFDPARRRAGIPEGVAALVEKLSADGMTLTLVNTDSEKAKDVILQAGGYGEHDFVSVATAGKTTEIGGPTLNVRLAPGAGTRLVFRMKRYANQPTLSFPWTR